LNKKIAAYAIIVVAILVIAAVAVVLLTPPAGTKVIYWTQIAPVNQKAALAAGTVDGAIGWEPYCSDALSTGNASVIVRSEQVWPDHPCCIMAVKYSDSFTDTPANNELVARVVKANMVATDWVTTTINEGSGANYTSLIQMGAQFSGIQASVVQTAIGNITYGNQLTPAVQSYFANFTEMFKTLNQTSSYGGYANATAFADAITNTSYLEMASSIQPSATILGSVRIGYLNGDLHQFARLVAMNASLWGGKTLFQVYGVNTTSPAPYANGGGVMDGFAAGLIDVGYLGCPPTILKRINANIQVQIISLVNSEGSALIGKGSIDSLSKLDGKIVATPGPASIQHLLLLYYCNLNGYQLKLKGT
jgi:NitT/TauT family transport system substrate-binding protein